MSEHDLTERNSLGILGIEIMRALQEDAGCPVCRLKHESAQRYTTWTLHEYVNSASFLRPFLQAVGLCQEHWDMFVAEGDVLGISILTEAMLSQAIVHVDDSMRKISEFGPRMPKEAKWAQAFSWTKGLGTCHVCEIEAEAEQRYAWGIAKLCAEGLLEAAKVAKVLCFRHLVMTAQEATPQDALEMLSVYQRELERLRADCGQIVSSFDYRYKGEKPDTAPLSKAIREVSLPGPGGRPPL